MVCARDELPHLVSSKKPGVVIANTNRVTDDGVGHWVCFYFAFRGDVMYFFDPLGMRPNEYCEELDRFAKRNAATVVVFSSIRIQKRRSIRCGEYCLYFLAKMLEGTKPHSIFSSMMRKSESYLTRHVYSKNV